jgi:DNA-binding response OmpR family regulator
MTIDPSQLSGPKPASSPAARPVNADAPPPARILVADDEPRIRLVLRAALESEGYEVLEAADGLEALDAVIRAAPDVLILDLAMPNLDGLRTVEKLQGVHGQLKPRIIVLTAWGSGPAMLKTIGLGASLFLEKPIVPSVLRSAVRVVLNEGSDVERLKGIPIDWTEVLKEERTKSGN